MVILYIFVVYSALASASAGVSQYYVNPFAQSFHHTVQQSPAPLSLVHPQPFGAPVLQNRFLNFPQIYHTPSAFVTHTLNPFLQQPFSIAQPVDNFGQSQARSNFGRNLDTATTNPAGGTEYGFGYRTQYDDGASSMVVFVMGPESQKVEFGRSNKVTARKLASDLLDGPTTYAKKSEEVSNVLSNSIPSPNFNSLLEAYPMFKDLEQPKTSVLHLYNHPANVFHLPSPNYSPSSTPSSTTSSSPESVNNDDPESVAIEAADVARSLSSENEADGAESMIQESNVHANNMSSERSEETSQSSSTENSSESSSPSTTSTTTEESTDEENDAVEITTSQKL